MPRRNRISQQFIPTNYPVIRQKTFLKLLAEKIFHIFIRLFDLIDRKLFPESNPQFQPRLKPNTTVTYLEPTSLLFLQNASPEAKKISIKGEAFADKTADKFLQNMLVNPLVDSEKRTHGIKQTKNLINDHISHVTEKYSIFTPPIFDWLKTWDGCSEPPNQLAPLLEWCKENASPIPFEIEEALTLFSSMNFQQPFPKKCREIRNWLTMGYQKNAYQTLYQSLKNTIKDKAVLKNVIQWFNSPNYDLIINDLDQIPVYQTTFSIAIESMWEAQLDYLSLLEHWINDGQLPPQGSSPRQLSYFKTGIQEILKKKLYSTLDFLEIQFGESLPLLVEKLSKENSAMMTHFVLTRICQVFDHFNFHELITMTASLLIDHSNSMVSLQEAVEDERSRMFTFATTATTDQIRQYLTSILQEKIGREDLIQPLNKINSRDLKRFFRSLLVQKHSFKEKSHLFNALFTFFSDLFNQAGYSALEQSVNEQYAYICHPTIRRHIQSKKETFSTATLHEIQFTQSIANSLIENLFPPIETTNFDQTNITVREPIEYLCSQINMTEEVEQTLEDLIYLSEALLPEGARTIIFQIIKQMMSPETIDHVSMEKGVILQAIYQGLHAYLVDQIGKGLDMFFETYANPEFIAELISSKLFPALYPLLYQQLAQIHLEHYFLTYYAKDFYYLVVQNDQNIKEKLAYKLHTKVYEKLSFSKEDVIDLTSETLIPCIEQLEKRLQGANSFEDMCALFTRQEKNSIKNHTVFGELFETLLINDCKYKNTAIKTFFPLIKVIISQLISSGIGTPESFKKLMLNAIGDFLEFPQDHSENIYCFENEAAKISRITRDLISTGMHSFGPRQNDSQALLFSKSALKKMMGAAVVFALGNNERMIQASITDFFNSLFSQNIPNRSLLAQITQLANQSVASASKKYFNTIGRQVIVLDELPLFMQDQ